MSGIRTNRWREIDAIFDEALERPADERSAFVRARCGDDSEVYRAVTRLLAAEKRSASVIGEHAADFVPALIEEHERREDLAPGQRVGPYEIEAEVGRGGMGVVYAARRADGAFDRRVALKMVKRGMDTDEILRRFQFERRVLAALDHPRIARLIDAGAADDGRPYLVVELAAGEPITTFAQSRELPVSGRLQLFRQVCEAVAYAHRALVVHRDIKPSNILVIDSESGPGAVKLLDFGIAKLLGPDTVGDGTRTGLYPMTPAYASPEQTAGGTITTASDVYSLGVVLYELLAGKRPPEGPWVPPSVSAERESERRVIAGDLDTITQTALHGDPSRRYATVDAILADLENHERSLPLNAKAETRLHRMRKFVRRHKWGVAASAAAAAALLVFSTVVAVQQRATNIARNEALATASFMGSLFANEGPASERRDTLRVRDLLRRGAVRARSEFGARPRMRGQLLHEIGETYLALGLYPQADSVLSDAVDARRAAGGDIPLASSLLAASAARREVGEAESAIAMAREAMSMIDGRPADALLNRAERQMALALIDQGKPDEAEPVIRKSVARLEVDPSDETKSDLAEARVVLGRTLMSRMQIEAAIGEYETAIRDLGEVFGDESPQRMRPLRELSFLLMMDGRLDEAAATATDAVAITRATRPGSGSLAAILSVQGTILSRRGDLLEAEEALREALTLPPRRSTDRAVALGTLATVLDKQGKLADALESQREAVDILIAASGPQNSTTAFSRMKLARLLVAAEKYREAESHLLAVKDVLSSSQDRHGQSDQALEALVDLYERWGRPAQAARWRRAMSSE